MTLSMCIYYDFKCVHYLTNHCLVANKKFDNVKNDKNVSLNVSLDFLPPPIFSATKKLVLYCMCRATVGTDLFMKCLALIHLSQ